MRLLSNLHVKGKPAVLPDRAILRQSHYFIYRPRASLFWEELKPLLATYLYTKLFKALLATSLYGKLLNALLATSLFWEGFKPLLATSLYTKLFKALLATSLSPVHPPLCFLKRYFNIIFPSTRSSSKWSLSVRHPHQNHVCTCFAS